MNFIRVHEIPEVPNNNNNEERPEIMETTADLISKLHLFDAKVLWVRDQTVIGCQALRIWFPTMRTIWSLDTWRNLLPATRTILSWNSFCCCCLLFVLFCFSFSDSTPYLSSAHSFKASKHYLSYLLIYLTALRLFMVT